MTTSPSDDDRIDLESIVFMLSQQTWMERAACRGFVKKGDGEKAANPFFPEQGQPTAIAYEMCASCPVREECGEYRAKSGSIGIWAGELHSSPRKRQIQDGRPRRIG